MVSLVATGLPVTPRPAISAGANVLWKYNPKAVVISSVFARWRGGVDVLDAGSLLYTAGIDASMNVATSLDRVDIRPKSFDDNETITHDLDSIEQRLVRHTGLSMLALISILVIGIIQVVPWMMLLPLIIASLGIIGSLGIQLNQIENERHLG